MGASGFVSSYLFEISLLVMAMVAVIMWRTKNIRKGWAKRDYFNLYLAIWLVLLTLEVFSLHMQLRSLPH